MTRSPSSGFVSRVTEQSSSAGRWRTMLGAVCAAVIISGLAPWARLWAVRTSVAGLLVAAVASVAAGVLLAGGGRSRLRSPLRALLAAAAVGTVASIGARTTVAMPDPSPVSRAIVGAWFAVGCAAAWWIVSGARVPVLGRFDPRSRAPVTVLVLYSAGVASDQARLRDALVAYVGALGVAVVLRARGAGVARCRAAVRSRRFHLTRSARGALGDLRRLVSSVPLPLRLLWVVSMLWWAANVRFWFVGVTRSGEVGYRGWVEGFLGPQWFRSAFAVFHVVGWTLTVLLVGVAVTLYGRRSVRWIVLVAVVSTAIGVLGVLAWRLGDAAWRNLWRVPEVLRWVF